MRAFIIFCILLIAVFLLLYFFIMYYVETEVPPYREGLPEFEKESRRTIRMVQSLKNFFRYSRDLMKAFFQIIGESVKKAFKWLKDFPSKIKQWLEKRKSDVKEGLEQEKQEVKEEIGNIFSRTWDWLKGKIRAALD